MPQRHRVLRFTKNVPIIAKTKLPLTNYTLSYRTPITEY